MLAVYLKQRTDHAQPFRCAYIARHQNADRLPMSGHLPKPQQFREIAAMRDDEKRAGSIAGSPARSRALALSEVVTKASQHDSARSKRSRQKRIQPIPAGGMVSGFQSSG
ncbi:hypothetical protein QWZ10_25135 [Paracoccus cavernae]|uniref:Uncharacterized protein n=1 Tax=Paracoccus cavernae TaxID=1571207 RepID=A0ABT8DH82_9RHOB|nr:hypothetical protein [Paracoccus cavernae]